MNSRIFNDPRRIYTNRPNDTGYKRQSGHTDYDYMEDDGLKFISNSAVKYNKRTYQLIDTNRNNDQTIGSKVNLNYKPIRLIEPFTNHNDSGSIKCEKFLFGKETPKVLSQSGNIMNEVDNGYLKALRIRAIAVTQNLLTDQHYNLWLSNWKLLDHNLNKTGLLFERLEQSDADIAYVINKGEEIKFRIRDQSRHVPINVYQYVLYHEMAHMSTNEWQHTEKFHELLSLITLSAYELGFIDLSRLKTTTYTTGGQPIIDKKTFAGEICDGAQLMIDNNISPQYFYGLSKHVINR